MNKTGYRRLLAWLLCVMLLPPTTGQAAAGEGPDAHPIDTQHERISQRVLDANRWMNRLLDRSLNGWQTNDDDLDRATAPSDFELRGSHMRVSPWVLFNEGGGHDIGIDYGLRLRLLPLSDRLHFFAARYDTDRETLDTSTTDRYRREPEPSRNDPALAGLTYFLLHDVVRQLSLSGGIRFRPAPEPRLRLRGRYRHPLGDEWLATFEQSGYWDSTDGFGERSQVAFSRPAGEWAHINLVSSLVWSELSRGLDWGHVSSCHIALGTTRSLQFRAGALGYTHPGTVVDQYLVRTPVRHRFMRDWMVLQIEPGVDWFREHNYRAALLVSIKLEVRFGAADAYGL